MKLSEALRTAELQSEKTPTGVKFTPVEQCVGKFELLTEYPIFLENGEDLDCEFWDLLPEESKPKGVTNISFLCDFLDCLWIAHGWTREQLADLVEKIENRLVERGLGEDGAAHVVL